MPTADRIPAALLVAGMVAAVLAGTAGGAPINGDAARGKQLFERECAVCHTVVPGFHKEGPSLYGIYGRRAGSAAVFTRYKGLKRADFAWSDEALDRWLADPRAFLGGGDTAMILKVGNPRERADIIAYLRTLR